MICRWPCCSPVASSFCFRSLATYYSASKIVIVRFRTDRRGPRYFLMGSDCSADLIKSGNCKSNVGNAVCTVSQTTSKLISKYPCAILFRIPLILRQEISLFKAARIGGRNLHMTEVVRKPRTLHTGIASCKTCCRNLIGRS